MDIIPLRDVYRVAILILVFFVLWHAWYVPWKKQNEERKLRELFEKHCPEKLLETLLVYYMGYDRDFTKLTPDARKALENAFSEKGVAAGIEILTTGKTTILLYAEGSQFQNLSVVFQHGKFSSAHLSPPYRACTMPVW